MTSVSLTQSQLLAKRSFDFEVKVLVGPQYDSNMVDVLRHSIARGASAWDPSPGGPDPENPPTDFSNYDTRDFTAWSAWATSDEIGFFDITRTIGTIDIQKTAVGDTGRCTTILTGNGYRSDVMRQGATVVAHVRVNPGTDMVDDGRFGVPGWTDWGVLFVGYIKEISLATEGAETGAFRMEVAHLMGHADTYLMDPVVINSINIAEGRPITISTEETELTGLIALGEFADATADADPSNAVDGVRLGSPTVSADWPATGTVIEHEAGGILEVYRPPTGYGDEYQWISIIGPIHVSGIAILGKGSQYWHPHQVCVDGECDPEYCIDGWRDLLVDTGNVVLAQDETLVVCYDKNRAKELYPAILSADHVVEWRDKSPDTFYNYDTDRIIVCNGDGPLTRDLVQWSTDSEYEWPNPIHEDSDGSGPCEGGENVNSHWSGDPVDPTGWVPGSALARQYLDGGDLHTRADTNTAADWSVNTLPNPPRGIRTLDPEWIIIDLGDVECNTTESFDPTADSEIVVDTTYGMARSGYGIVTGQVFAYGGKLADRLIDVVWYGTSSVVGTGNPISQYDAETELAMVGWRVKQVKLWRRPMMTHIASGELFGSRYPGPLLEPDAPAEDEWFDDWPVLGNSPQGMVFAGNNASIENGLISIDFPFDEDHPERYRIKWLLVLAQSMMGNGAFVAADADNYRQDSGPLIMNEIEVYVHSDTESVSDNGDLSASNIGDALTGLLMKSGMPYWTMNAIDCDSPFTAQAISQVFLTKAIDALCRSYGIVAVERANSTIHIRRNVWHASAAQRDRAALNVTIEADSVTRVAPKTTGYNQYKQARVFCREPLGQASFIGVSPRYSVSDVPGGIYTNSSAEPYVVTTQYAADDLAASVLRQKQSQRAFEVTMTGLFPALYPFDIVIFPHTISAQSDNDGGTDEVTTEVRVVVTSAIDSITLGNDTSDKNWVTTFTGNEWAIPGEGPIE